MSVIELSPEQKKRVRRIILFRPTPARLHRKAVILYQLSRWDDAREMALHFHLSEAAIDGVLGEFRARGLDAMIDPEASTAEHRDSVKDVERSAPSREKFRSMLGRAPVPEPWFDDADDWDL